MRGWLVVVILLASGAAEAKRIACTQSLGPGERVPGDMIPPAAPRVDRVYVENNTLSIDGRFPDDTARIHITFQDVAGETVEVWTTAQRLYVCIPRPPRPYRLISIAAVDASGNETFTVAHVHSEGRYHCGMGAMALLFFGIPALAILALITLVIRSAMRRRKLKLPGTSLSPLVAEAMTRAVINDLLVIITLGFTLSTVLYFTDDAVFAAIIAWVPISRLLRLVFARRFLGYLESGLPAELHDNLLATVGTFILVPRSIARAAQRESMPAAISRRP